MKTSYVRLVGVVVLLSGAAIAQMPMTYRYVKVNHQSFADEPGLSGDVTNAVVNAIHTWSAYAGSAEDYMYDGDTSDTGCGAGSASNHIWGTSQCPWFCPACDCVLAQYAPCTFGGYSLQLYKTNNDYRLVPTASSHIDFQATVAHEIGHNLMGLYHGDPADGTQCIMSQGSANRGDDINHRYACQEEITHVQAVGVGWHHDRPQFTTNSTTNIDANSWSNPISLLGMTGFGFGDVGRGRVGTSASGNRDTFFWTRNDDQLLTGQQSLCDYRNPVASNCSTWWTSTWTNADRRRVSVAFDPLRSIWWRFIPGDRQTRDLITVAYSTDRVNWTTLGALQGSTGLVARTRVPVSASYDPRSDSIVVATSMFNPQFGYPTTGSGCPTIGCTGEIMIYTVRVSSPGAQPTFRGPFRFGSSPTVSAYNGYGAPAVVCGDELYPTWGWNCVVMMTDNSAERRLVHWFFRVYGGVFDFSGVLVTGGHTSDPVSLTKNTDVPFLAAIRGLNGRNMWQNKLSPINGTWGGWQQINQGTIHTSHGPVIRVSPWVTGVDLFFVP